MTQEQDIVLYSVEDSIARIRLNRPDKRNALNDELVAAIKDSLITASSVTNLRVVVISGEGKDFCSGADLSALQKISRASVSENADDASSLAELFILIRQLEVPVVAAVKGRALAGGCGLASACDIVVAASSARFGYPEVKIGFVPAMVLAILRRNVSEKKAFELLTRGEEISAEDGLRFGLVNQVYEDEVFEAELETYLKRYAGVSKSAVSLTKKFLYQVDNVSFIEALQTGVDVNVIARMTEDCQKGIARFLKN